MTGVVPGDGGQRSPCKSEEVNRLPILSLIYWALDRRSAYGQRDRSMVFLKIDPLLRNLHGDPRYQVLLHKMNLAD